ncbi:GntR family transcriptional regulator [Actinorhabdospora filicis]|uniref:GntR family transcriptional regulator n=1 Tax=Actinorhabdospora filicis TaxID=1785913 RepID=A0A9W6SSZ9_9ACTN|nr:GntR family transcriptional regulator [Actinorhabdospora filicis]GLZ81946.1 GntR family transcriptional regulator [Actinorhabdospora filicis]
MSRSSTVDLIAARIREAITAGDLPPGSPLGEAELAEQLGVSRGPLREGMQRLVQEGLLTSVRRRGLGVPCLSADEVTDVYVMRAAVERAACLRLLALDAAGLTAVARSLEGEVRRMTRASRKGDADHLGEADINFHRDLVDAAGSSRLSRAIRTLLIESRLSVFSMQDHFTVPADLPADHEAIVAALRERDRERLLGLVQSHMDEAVRRLTWPRAGKRTLEAHPPEEPRGLGPIRRDGPHGTV